MSWKRGAKERDVSVGDLVLVKCRRGGSKFVLPFEKDPWVIIVTLHVYCYIRMMVQEYPMESATEWELDRIVSPDQQGVLGHHQDHSSEPHHFALWKKGGRLFSALVAINILLLGCCLITSGSLKQVAIDDLEVMVFLSILMLLSVLWMCVQMYLTKQQDAVLFKDHHAGPIWMRGR
ncbi:hypothetical protein NDU88_008359 [Pleurodeles waltl]|uniref:Uncharacterized protein n=1 Tax=Pleurodeles waltl TaxID=8319 RepID=A0AAV7PSN2_PLEWA|nr:hypothetical protein NDU88_008359 [Pleurodeles waltl]